MSFESSDTEETEGPKGHYQVGPFLVYRYWETEDERKEREEKRERLRRSQVRPITPSDPDFDEHNPDHIRAWAESGFDEHNPDHIRGSTRETGDPMQDIIE